MCGITGFVDLSNASSRNELITIVTRMTDTLYHRGPDSSGIWIDERVGLAFGHRRLAIVDLSVDGSQPMCSTTGRYMIVFNGEIYNFRDLRHKLENQGWGFRSSSDTEVMLAAIEAWGLREAVSQFTGMFAFALWDKQEKSLFLGRDRLGEKPLYYGKIGNTFMFASELKALKVHPDFRGTICLNAVGQYLRHNYIPAPYSVYEDIFKLNPGEILELNCAAKDFNPQKYQYWSIKNRAAEAIEKPFSGTVNNAIDKLELLLRKSIQRQLLADVPVGAFLSGGIDSSTIVALAQQISTNPVNTFSIGFTEDKYNEARHAKEVSKHLGTNHTELYVTPRQAMDVIPGLPDLFDEPFADSSQIPTFLVSQLAKQKVTVCLSGDGGDELFGGYTRYQLSQTIWNSIGWIPRPFRVALVNGGKILDRTSISCKLMRNSMLGDKLLKFSELAHSKNRDMLYLNLISLWKEPAKVLVNFNENIDNITNYAEWPEQSDYIHRMMYLDLAKYLPDDILVKVDRAGMGVSLENRVPLLDHELVEFALSLPTSYIRRDGKSKWLLRQVLYRYVPPRLVERPKKGFSIPIDEWLRTSLKPWADELLSDKALRDTGVFQPEPIQKKWQEHISGNRNWHHHLWGILMFQAWINNNRIR